MDMMLYNFVVTFISALGRSAGHKARVLNSYDN